MFRNGPSGAVVAFPGQGLWGDAGIMRGFMRRFLIMACLGFLAACGGGGGGSGADGSGGGSSGGGSGTAPNTADFVAFLRSDWPTTNLEQSAVPAQPIALQGSAGARLGWTNRAIIGAAHMTVDFGAGFVSGRVDQLGLYTVSTDLPLRQTTPMLLNPLNGQFTFAGTIPEVTAAQPTLGFSARYSGAVSGVTAQEPVELSLDGITHRGLFMHENGHLYAVGQLDGVIVRRHPGGHAIEETLREGLIIVAAPH